MHSAQANYQQFYHKLEEDKYRLSNYISQCKQEQSILHAVVLAIKNSNSNEAARIATHRGDVSGVIENNLLYIANCYAIVPEKIAFNVKLPNQKCIDESVVSMGNFLFFQKSGTYDLSTNFTLIDCDKKIAPFVLPLINGKYMFENGTTIETFGEELLDFIYPTTAFYVSDRNFGKF